jgi:hypothetical protein
MYMMKNNLNSVGMLNSSNNPTSSQMMPIPNSMGIDMPNSGGNATYNQRMISQIMMRDQ